MSGQYFGDRYNNSNNFENNDQEVNNPVVNSDPFADKVPVDAALIHETAMGGTIAAVAPLNEPLPEVVPMFETPLQEIPMGGTVAAVGPMNPPLTEVTPTYEAPIQQVPIGETVAVVGLVSESVVYVAPVAETVTHEAPVVTNPVTSVALLNHEESEHFRTRWNEIQGTFVDEPRAAVQQADALVSEVILHITQMFAKEHSALDSQWNQGSEVSTEDLRKALQHYRSFFNRLVV